MLKFDLTEEIRQFDEHSGGYGYLFVPADVVRQFPKQKKTRLICTIEGEHAFACGLNHLGDGNFFIYVAKARLKALGKRVGERVRFEIHEDPNPLGAEIPEVIEAVLDEDEAARETFEKMTDGRKRTLIHMVNRIKNVDRQIEKIFAFLEEHRHKKPRGRW